MSNCFARSQAQNGHTMKTETTNTTVTKRLYNLKDASVYLGRTVGAVREMLWAGKMPFVKDGKRILVDIEDMNRWIERSKTQNTF